MYYYYLDNDYIFCKFLEYSFNYFENVFDIFILYLIKI